ncbi:MAG: efflux RND transporter periplasmic adaptor subunit [Prochloraceae cyanobacterium]|nr:efflux RND transporter periplasmic adaptor subunit [Prochloraceae cyanobacterium]
MKVNRNILAAAILSGIVTGACGQNPNSQGQFGNQAVPVRLATVETGTIEDSSTFLGTLEAEDRVTLQPETEGRIVNIYVRSGQRVAKGTPILQLKPDRDRARVETAIASANAAQASQESAKAQLQAARSRSAKASADLNLAEADFKRNQNLVDSGVLERRELEVSQRDIVAAKADLQQAKDDIEAAKANLDQATAQYKQARAQVRLDSATLQFSQVLAPISGVVGDVSVKQGDFVNTQSTITTITQNDYLDLRISVPVARSRDLKIGLPVELIDPNSREILARGQVDFISPTVDSSLQNILVKARFINNNRILRDRQFVSAKIIWKEEPGILIPTVSVSRLGGQNFVFVAAENNEKVLQKPVRLGPIQGSNYRVIEGITPGENIAVTNIIKLRHEAKITPAVE